MGNALVWQAEAAARGRQLGPGVGQTIIIHGKVDRQEATGAARVRGGGCGDYYYLAKHSAMHWFGKQKQLHAGDRWGGGEGGLNYLFFSWGRSLKNIYYYYYHYYYYY